MTSFAPPPATPVFGDVLRRLRTAATLSQEELAERAGLSVRAVSNLERGVHQAPRLETVRLLADALRLEATDRAGLIAAARPDLAVSPTPVSEQALPQAALPLPATRLIGREREVAEVGGLLAQSESRLVTLTGPGGVGKTRLALQVAAQVLEQFADGVFVVELAPLADAALVPAAIAQVLGVRAEGSQPLIEVLATYIRSKSLLLVIDNFEHLLPGAPAVSRLLRDAPRLKVLATSRAPLRLRGEREFPVGPLEVPDIRRSEPVERLSQYDAVQLFIARAQDATPDFAMSPASAPAVAEICARLDGLPLAIELAAARSKLLSPPALLARLERRLPLLTGGARDAPERQQALWDTIAWSYDLLSPSEQMLFRRLAVFAGGVSLEAAEAVGNPSGEIDVFSGLAALVDESLVRTTASAAGDRRFAMLETVREFGLDMLTASGELAEMRTRHAAWVLEFAEEAEQALHGSEQITWLDRLDLERDNLRTAFAWALESGDMTTAFRLATGLSSFWEVRGTMREWRSWVERALQRFDAAPAALRAEARFYLFWLIAMEGDREAAERVFAQAVAEAHDVEMPMFEAWRLFGLAQFAMMRGDLERAAELFDATIEQFQRSGVPVPQLLLTTRANVERRRWNRDQSRALFEEALVTFRAMPGDKQWVAEAFNSLGDLDCDAGDFARAAANYGGALTQARALKDTWSMTDAVLGFAAVATGMGKPERGARLLGAAEGLYERIGIALPPFDRDNYPKTVAATRAALSESKFSAAHAAGRALTIEQAVAEAMALAEEVGTVARG
jgi:predicted ATPase/DNA-binding XRE family transcriptional regulator